MLRDQALIYALHRVGRYEEAIHACDVVCRDRPDDRWALLVRAWSWAALRYAERASAGFDAAARRHPRDRLLLLERIRHFVSVSRWDEAQAAFHAVLPSFTGMRPPVWDGRPLQGETLLTDEPTGFGDTLQFVRYAALAQAHGARVAVTAQRPLRRLVRGVPGVAVAVRRHDRVGGVRVQSQLSHLGLLLAPPGAWTGTADAYLRVSPRAVMRWRRARAAASRLHVGIVWAGSDQHRLNPARANSMALDQMARLAVLPGVRLYSLQVGPHAQALRAPGAPRGIVDWGSALTDFSALAAAMCALDAIVAVDTAAAHLAGALGAPCWLVLPYVACWRWGLHGRTTPWYPSMRLCRQSRPGCWTDAIADVAHELQQFQPAGR